MKDERYSLLNFAQICNFFGLASAILALLDIFIKFGSKVLLTSFGLAFIALLFFFLARFQAPSRICKNIFGKSWATTVIFITFMLAALSLSAHFINLNSKSGSFLGDHVPAIDRLRKQLGIIEEQIESLHKKSDTLLGKIEGTQQLANPRLELSRNGVQWTAYGYCKSISEGDIKAVELFLKGKMQIDIQDEEYMLPAPFMLVRDTTQNQDDIISLMVKSGLDLDKKYTLTSSVDSGKIDELSRKFGPLIRLNYQFGWVPGYSCEVTLWQWAVLTDQPRTLQRFINHGVSEKMILSYITTMINDLRQDQKNDKFKGYTPEDCLKMAVWNPRKTPKLDAGLNDDMAECIETTHLLSKNWQQARIDSLNKTLEVIKK